MKMSFWHCCLYCSLSLFIVHCKHAMLLQYCRCTGSQMAAETFNSLLKSNPGSQTHWYSPWPLSHDVCIDLLRKKLYITCHILQPGSSWISRPNLFSVHIIALDIDLSWNVFNFNLFHWNTEDDFFERQIDQKIFTLKIEACPKSSNQCIFFEIAFIPHISFVTNVADGFKVFPHSHLKSLCCLIRIWADSLFKDS